MCRYVVVETRTALGEWLLQDGAGRLHLATSETLPPPPGTVLHGPQPPLGFILLSAETAGRIWRCELLLVACGRAAVLDRWVQRRRAGLRAVPRADQVLPKRDLALATQAVLA